MGKEKTVIPKIVITGGPCSGKSKGLAMLMRKLSEMGVMVVVVPETATDIYSRGVRIGEIENDPERWKRFQRVILKAQLDSERTSSRLARIHPGKSKVIICDRGAMDNMAYVEIDSFREIARSVGFQNIGLLRDRYTAVFFLVSAAIGAEDCYNQNNPQRRETVAEAVKVDRKTLAAWIGHEHLTIIGNRKNGNPVTFSKKMETLKAAVCHSLRIPVPIEIEKKFLVEFDNKPPEGAVAFDIFQTYLRRKTADIERRVRARVPVDHDISQSAACFYTEKKIISDSEREEDDEILTAKEYAVFLKERDPERKNIRKRRFCFAWDDQYFQLDFFSEPLSLAVLEIELTDRCQIPILPDFLKVIRDVTGDARFRNDGIAAGLCPGYR